MTSRSLIVIICICAAFACRQQDVKKVNVTLKQVVDTTFPLTVFGFTQDLNDTTLFIKGRRIQGTIGYGRTNPFQNHMLLTLRNFPNNNNFLVFKSVSATSCAMAFDTNNDGKLDDEYLYQSDKSPFIPLSGFEYCVNKICKNGLLLIKPVVSTLLINEKKHLSKYGFILCDILRVGEIEINNKKYKILVDNLLQNTYNPENCVVYIQSPTDTNYKECTQVRYKIGDTIYAGDNLLKPVTVDSSGRDIQLEMLPNSSKGTGLTTGYLLPQHKTKLLESKKEVIIGGEKDYYTLIDFWGTWCTPCIELTRDLKSLNEKSDSSKVKFLGIAVDDEKDAKQYIQHSSITWDQILDNFEQKEISNKYKVDAFPCFILLDKTGRIIYRGNGKSAFAQVRQIVQNL